MIKLQELRIITVLTAIFGLRMLGIGMLMPVFAVEALKYSNSNPQLIGFAVGVYGLAQAVLQIPYGMLSDRFGRKPLILTGLVSILLGSLICWATNSIYGLIIGRVLQGSGAIGSVVLAMLSDHIREQVRTSAMAILGAGIGLSLALALVLGPWLNHLLGLSGLFAIMAVFSIMCALLLFAIPNTQNFKPSMQKLTRLEILHVVFDRKLIAVNFGVFALHASFAAFFLIIPGLLVKAGISEAALWKFYLGTITAAMLVAWRLIKYSEQQQNIATLQLVAILGLLFAVMLLYTLSGWLSIALSLLLFFSAFCVLEASLPALVSKYAVEDKRGTALGIYSCLQFLGVFVGGAVGGWLHGRFGMLVMLGFCILLIGSWLSLTILSNRLRGELWRGV